MRTAVGAALLAIVTVAAPGGVDAGTFGIVTPAIEGADTTATPPPDDSRPITTANEFLPEDRDVTDCIGALERPGCGNENRGGWRQTVVFGLLVVGLLIVFGNVVRGVRRRG